MRLVALFINLGMNVKNKKIKKIMETVTEIYGQQPTYQLM